MIFTVTKYLSVLVLSIAFGAESAGARNADGSAAEISQQHSAGLKINLAGRQRMLTQHIAKSVCFAQTGVLAEQHQVFVEQASLLFETTLAALRDGDAGQGVTPETNPEILGALQEVDGLWRPMSETLNAWLGGDASSARLEVIYENNLPLLKASHQVVEMLEATYGGSEGISSYKAAAVNISGRQRMLSQKMSKEFCLAHLGHKSEQNLAMLAKTLETFETAHKALLYGDGTLGLAESAPYAIRQQLEFAIACYSEIAPTLSKASQGAPMRETDVLSVASTNLRILSEIDKAVKMFERM